MIDKLNIILLSGGSGKRLWPLSNDIRSKQFIKFFKKPNAVSDGENDYESMVQRIYRQIKTEPCRRDTFAAIALATAYLHDVKGIDSSEAVVVCPVDPCVEDNYFQCLKVMYQTACKGKENLVLMGIKPTYPSEKYGYIIPAQDQAGNYSLTFTEKPTPDKAEEYIAQGAFWNGGVFAYKLKYVLEKSMELLGTANYHELYCGYSNLKKISFDYAVVEQEKSIKMVQYSGTWKDLGTWNTLTEAMDENIIGNAKLVMGCRNLVVSASPDGILVSDKDASSGIKPYVDSIVQQIMYAEKSWGNYQVIDIKEKSMTIKVTLNPGKKMNYHSHDHRDEIWTVVSGQGKTFVDGIERSVKTGDVIKLPAGSKHTVIAETKLVIIEIQLGKDISVKDKHKYDLET